MGRDGLGADPGSVDVWDAAHWERACATRTDPNAGVGRSFLVPSSGGSEEVLASTPTRRSRLTGESALLGAGGPHGGRRSTGIMIFGGVRDPGRGALVGRD